MENFCKPKIEEKHYSYDRTQEQNIRNDAGQSEVKNIECRKTIIGNGIFRKAEYGDAPEILVC